MKRRICLFAHYDARQRIAPYVMHYLEQLHHCGFVTHIALSGMAQIQPADRAVFDRLGVVAHCRPNRGLDFGAWAALEAAGCTAGADTILLANDSVFGPMQPLAPIFGTMEGRGADVWGMIESLEGSWHLQSWFLCFTARAFASPAVARVRRLAFDDMGKAEIVLHGELGLGAAIRSDGLRWDARWRQPGRRLRRLVPGNPMHLDFLSVLRSGVPFIKVELLRDNPTAIAWIARWRAAVAQHPLFHVAWIDDHLGMAGRHVAPRPRQSIKMRLLQAAITRDWPEAIGLR